MRPRVSSQQTQRLYSYSSSISQLMAGGISFSPSAIGTTALHFIISCPLFFKCSFHESGEGAIMRVAPSILACETVVQLIAPRLAFNPATEDISYSGSHRHVPAAERGLCSSSSSLCHLYNSKCRQFFTFQVPQRKLVLHIMKCFRLGDVTIYLRSRRVALL